MLVAPDADIRSADVAFLADGQAACLWTGTGGVHASHFDPASGWGTAEVVATHARDVYRFVAFTSDGNGNAVAVWDNRANLFAAQLLAGQGWQSAVQPTLSQPSESPDVAVDSSGNAVVAWASDSFGTVNAMHYRAGEGWGATVALQQTDGDSYHNPRPTAALSDSGLAVIAWGRQDTGNDMSVWAAHAQF
jgi:hypothetical protein